MTPLSEPPACARCELTARCIRCGSPIHDDQDLGQLAEAALRSLARGRTVSAKVVLEMVSQEAACRLGACRARG